MEIDIGIAVLAIGHIVVFLVLVLLVTFSGRRRELSRRSRLARVKNQREQQLLQEVISSCEGLFELPIVVKAVCDHAAEATGYREWMIWLVRDDHNYRVVDCSIQDFNFDLQDLRDSVDPELYRWVRQNSAVLYLNRFVPTLSASRAMHKALERLSNGILVPLSHLGGIQGFLIVGGEQASDEKRSDQFLELFGSFAAIVIRNTQLHEQDQLRKNMQHQAEKLASLGKLAAGVAHEIRNPLAFIRASTQHLRKKYNYTGADSEIGDEIVEEIDRINKHVEDLLVLGKINPGEFRMLDLANVIRKVVMLVEMRARSLGIELSMNRMPERCLVNGNEELLRQLLLNLLLNAMEAMGDGGELAISFSGDEQPAEIVVSDTGGGIDPSIVNSIFDPFFTTKEKGTGLGLSMSYSIAQAHGGSLELLSSGPSGSSFAVRLPAAEVR
jgi:signal transduction histidine kinase